MTKQHGRPVESFLRWAGTLLVVVLLLGGCGRPTLRGPLPPPDTTQPPKRVTEPASLKRAPLRLGFTIQAGAFSRVENAARLTDALQEKGLSAFYFVARRGLYKVRFGNFPTREEAFSRAEGLRAAGVITEFYIVRPEQHALAKLDERGEAYLREEITRTARTYLGIPYLWGGTSAETGFDCSGLAMAVYQLNGLEIPRTSGEQFETGASVDRASLAKGDLLFFAADGKKISHVGIYAGGDQFIHAPGMGKQIRTDLLTKTYFSRTFMGGRNYLTGDGL